MLSVKHQIIQVWKFLIKSIRTRKKNWCMSIFNFISQKSFNFRLLFYQQLVSLVGMSLNEQNIFMSFWNLKGQAVVDTRINRLTRWLTGSVSRLFYFNSNVLHFKENAVLARSLFLLWYFFQVIFGRIGVKKD